MLKQRVKKIVAMTASMAILMSGATVFAQSDASSAEGLYGTKYIYNKYFKFLSESSTWSNKKNNPESGAAHVSTVKSFSGNRSLYVDGKVNQWFNRDRAVDGPSEVSSNLAAANKTMRFSCKISIDPNDVENFQKNTFFRDTNGTKHTFADFTCDTTQEAQTGWRTYSWEGNWGSKGDWMIGFISEGNVKFYMDDFKLEVKNNAGEYYTYIDENFDNTINFDLKEANFANANPINASTLRISWKNPNVINVENNVSNTNLTELAVYDITDGSKTKLFDQTNLPSTVSLVSRDDCYYDVTGLSANTYKKYKIVTTGLYGTGEVMVEGRTLRGNETSTSYGVDENGLSFAGNWRAQIGDGASKNKTGKWYLDTTNVHSGDASFAAEISYADHMRINYWKGQTFAEDTELKLTYWAKTEEGSVPTTVTAYNQWTALKSENVTSSEWTKYEYAWTQKANSAFNQLAMVIKASHPTTVYIDDISLTTKDGKQILVSGSETDIGWNLDSASIDLSGAKPAVTWKAYKNGNSSGDAKMYANIYYTSSNGNEEKLNSEAISLTSSNVANRFELNNVRAGKYVIEMVTDNGVVVKKAECVLNATTDIKEGVFENVMIWDEDFSELGQGASLSEGITTITTGDIMGSVTVSNYANENFNAVLVGALYKGGTLVGTVVNPFEVAAASSTTPAVAFQIAESENAQEYKMSMFIWDSVNGIKPLKSAQSIDSTGINK